MRSVIVGYRKTRLQPDELIIAVDIPFCKHENEFVVSYMQSRRREDDIAIASAAFRVEIESDMKISRATLVFGGMDAVTKRYLHTFVKFLSSFRQTFADESCCFVQCVGDSCCSCGPQIG